jgi:hypothetical protein
MILVAATAVGFAWMTWQMDALGFSFADVIDEAGPSIRESAGGGLPAVLHEVLRLAGGFCSVTTPVCAMWTLSLIPLRLIGPRPRRRRLGCQPGFLGACAANLAIVFFGVLSAVVLARGERSEDLTAVLLVFAAPTYIGLAVSASWLTLFVGGRWRAEPSWIDRVGRAMGAIWIAEAALGTICIVVGY